MPRCLTIILPGSTSSPPYFFTPSLRPALSRPFLDDPPAFFVAILFPNKSNYHFFFLIIVFFFSPSLITLGVFSVFFSAEAKIFPSFEKILLILINVKGCL